MAATLAKIKPGTFSGIVGTTPVREWLYVDSATTIAAMTAAAWFNVAGASSGDSSFTANDLVMCIGSNGVALRYVSDAGTGTVAALG